MRKMTTFLLLLCLSVLLPAQEKSRSDAATKILQSFVGEWEGSATAYYPRQEDKTPRKEMITVNARKMLKDTYVECSSVWTQPNGDYRELMIYWNYNTRADSFQILFFYDNWPGRVNYKLHFDPESRTLNGYDTFTGRGGVPAEEKVVWQISQDGNEIRCTEYNHYQTDPEDYWPTTFEFVWRRK